MSFACNLVIASMLPFLQASGFSHLYLIYIYYKLLNVLKKFYYNNEKVTKMSASFSIFFYSEGSYPDLVTF